MPSFRIYVLSLSSTESLPIFKVGRLVGLRRDAGVRINRFAYKSYGRLENSYRNTPVVALLLCCSVEHIKGQAILVLTDLSELLSIKSCHRMEEFRIAQMMVLQIFEASLFELRGVRS